MLSVLFQLGSLKDVQHVLQGQRMQPEQLAKGAHRVHIRQAVHVDPEHWVFVQELAHALDIGKLLLHELPGAIGHDANLRLLRTRIGNQHARQRSRRSEVMLFRAAASRPVRHGTHSRCGGSGRSAIIVEMAA